MYISFAKFCSQINFALIGHSITYWMRDSGFSIPTSIFFGSIFTFPYLFKYYLSYFAIKYCNFFVHNSFILYLCEFLFGLCITIFPLKSIEFCICVLVTSSLGALLDSLLLSEFYSRNINNNTPEQFGSFAYGLDLLGLIIGSDLPFFLSNYYPWITVYRYTLCVTFLIKLFSIGNLNLNNQKMPLNVWQNFLDCCKHGKDVIIITSLYKLQSAIISHTPTVYLKSIEYPQIYISIARFIAHFGMIYAVYQVRNIYKAENYLCTTIYIKGTMVFLISYFIYMRYDNLSILMIIFEKISRGVESCILTSIQAKYSSNSAHFIALNTLSNFIRLIAELLSGFIQSYTGWVYFFILIGSISFVVLWQIRKYLN